MKITKKTYIYIFLISVSILLSCGETFLEKKPQGVLNPDILADKNGINALLIGAYASLDGERGQRGAEYNSSGSNWVFGDVTSDDAYKGTDEGDQRPINDIERHELTSTNNYLDVNWLAFYDGIARANDVLKFLPQVPTSELTDAERRSIEGEAKFLRGHYYFQLKKFWNMVPWIDEQTTDFSPTNTEDIWPKIEADFQAAINLLPETQTQVGRATKGAARAYLAKSHMFQQEFTDAKTILDEIISSNRYQLAPNFHDNFRMSGNNNSESIFQIQRSVNDGADSYNGGVGDALNYPYNEGPGACCGFFQPSQNLVNAFQTDNDGLPLLTTFNNTDVKNDQGIESAEDFTPHKGNLDPRLDWTVGRRGIPYLDWGPHTGKAWIRSQAYGGPYSPKKHVYYKSETGSGSDGGGSWLANKVNANNYSVIRYADVLLWAAEAEVELNNLEEARRYVNMIRRRAKDGSKQATPTYATYVINEYTQTWTDQDVARSAVRFERRLELAMEGHRFFDLVRWQVADQVINEYFRVESTKRQYLLNANFTRGKNEYFPIPENQIILSSKQGKPTLTQNPGY